MPETLTKFSTSESNLQITGAKIGPGFGLGPGRAAQERAQRYTHDGKTLTLAEWAIELDIAGSTLGDRIRAYMPAHPEKVFTARRFRGDHKEVILEKSGERGNLRFWSRKMGIPYTTLTKRVSRRVETGATDMEILTAPVRRRGSLTRKVNLIADR